MVTEKYLFCLLKKQYNISQTDHEYYSVALTLYIQDIQVYISYFVSGEYQVQLSTALVPLSKYFTTITDMLQRYFLHYFTCSVQIFHYTNKTLFYSKSNEKTTVDELILKLSQVLLFFKRS